MTTITYKDASKALSERSMELFFKRVVLLLTNISLTFFGIITVITCLAAVFITERVAFMIGFRESPVVIPIILILIVIALCIIRKWADQQYLQIASFLFLVTVLENLPEDMQSSVTLETDGVKHRLVIVGSNPIFVDEAFQIVTTRKLEMNLGFPSNEYLFWCKQWYFGTEMAESKTLTVPFYSEAIVKVYELLENQSQVNEKLKEFFKGESIPYFVLKTNLLEGRFRNIPFKEPHKWKEEWPSMIIYLQKALSQIESVLKTS